MCRIAVFPFLLSKLSLEHAQLALLLSSPALQQANHIITVEAFPLPDVIFSAWPGGPALIHRAFQLVFHSGSSALEDNYNCGRTLMQRSEQCETTLEETGHSHSLSFGPHRAQDNDRVVNSALPSP